MKPRLAVRADEHASGSLIVNRELRQDHRSPDDEHDRELAPSRAKTPDGGAQAGAVCHAVEQEHEEEQGVGVPGQDDQAPDETQQDRRQRVVGV